MNPRNLRQQSHPQACFMTETKLRYCVLQTKLEACDLSESIFFFKCCQIHLIDLLFELNVTINVNFTLKYIGFTNICKPALILWHDYVTFARQRLG
jgi:hypothetical protein